MQQYEHLFIRKGLKVVDGFAIGGTVSYTENGRAMPYRGDKMWEVANRKGAEGWEVVSASEYGDDWDLVLKRAKL